MPVTEGLLKFAGIAAYCALFAITAKSSRCSALRQNGPKVSLKSLKDESAFVFLAVSKWKDAPLYYQNEN
jgi:hypothetical protein